MIAFLYEGKRMGTITKGDRVQLKTGSPTMTVSNVEDINGVEMAWCVWSDEKNKSQSATYAVSVLVKVK